MSGQCVEMYLSSALVLIALPFLVAAVPLYCSTSGGISIPLAKHSEFLNTDGNTSLAKGFTGVPLFKNDDYTWSVQITVGTPGEIISLSKLADYCCGQIN